MRNWLISLEMAAIILIISIIFGLALMLSIILVAAPFALLGILSIIFNSSVALSVILILGILVIALVIIVAGAIFSTFQYSSWVLLFFKLIKEGATSKIVRLFSSVFAKK